MLENNFYFNDSNLNIANIHIGTNALGPGYRAVIWVQGCPFNCPSCYSPAWIPQRQAISYSPDNLAEIISSNKEIDGITISGGEPMLQAKALICLVEKLKNLHPNYTFLLYTGYRKENLDKLFIDDPKVLLMNEMDVLIDGLYVDSLNNNIGLKGSTNQKVHYLSKRLLEFDFESTSRSNEIYVKNGEVHFIGVPDRNVMRLPEMVEQVYVRA